MTAIPLGRASLRRLDATYPPARAEPHFETNVVAATPLTPAYLVLLRAEIARFTRPTAVRQSADSSLLL